MNIQYFTDRDEETRKPIFKYIDVQILENATIKELFLKIHEMEGIPMYKKVTWNENTEKIACEYLIFIDEESGPHFAYLFDEDLEKKISEFPKDGPNGELSVFIETNVVRVN
ncbi:hypothetical protein [uncultured Dokdonia sp.]|uniref:hypothetical protein n=1 Tax=uncultured Dokdonia sp. TaxID=575653 RepID=UPI002618D203|nr:hypothetical protein [uncultured Dokdonia sp.]